MKPEKERVIKPCYVCGNAFDGLKYYDPYEMCPTCYKGLMQAMRREEKSHEQMQIMRSGDPLD